MAQVRRSELSRTVCHQVEMMIFSFLKYFREKSTASVYMLVYLLLFLMIGFWIRFQVYPIWMFFSVILSLCYAYWIKSDNKKVLFR